MKKSLCMLALLALYGNQASAVSAAAEVDTGSVQEQKNQDDVQEHALKKAFIQWMNSTKKEDVQKLTNDEKETLRSLSSQDIKKMVEQALNAQVTPQSLGPTLQKLSAQEMQRFLAVTKNLIKRVQDDHWSLAWSMTKGFLAQKTEQDLQHYLDGLDRDALQELMLKRAEETRIPESLATEIKRRLHNVTEKDLRNMKNKIWYTHHRLKQLRWDHALNDVATELWHKSDAEIHQALSDKETTKALMLETAHSPETRKEVENRFKSTTEKDLPELRKQIVKKCEPKRNNLWDAALDSVVVELWHTPKGELEGILDNKEATEQRIAQAVEKEYGKYGAFVAEKIMKEVHRRLKNTPQEALKEQIRQKGQIRALTLWNAAVKEIATELWYKTDDEIHQVLSDKEAIKALLGQAVEKNYAEEVPTTQTEAKIPLQVAVRLDIPTVIDLQELKDVGSHHKNSPTLGEDIKSFFNNSLDLPGTTEDDEKEMKKFIIDRCEDGRSELWHCALDAIDTDLWAPAEVEKMLHNTEALQQGLLQAVERSYKDAPDLLENVKREIARRPENSKVQDLRKLLEKAKARSSRRKDTHFPMND